MTAFEASIALIQIENHENGDKDKMQPLLQFFYKNK